MSRLSSHSQCLFRFSPASCLDVVLAFPVLLIQPPRPSFRRLASAFYLLLPPNQLDALDWRDMAVEEGGLGDEARPLPVLSTLRRSGDVEVRVVLVPGTKTAWVGAVVEFCWLDWRVWRNEL